MKKVNFILCFIFLGINIANAQDLEWAHSIYSGDNEDIRLSTVIDSNGNEYTSGFFYGTKDFDPGPGVFNLPSNGFGDIYILKLDTSGNFVWAKSVGGTDHDETHSITLDTQGNIYTTGYFSDTVDFDPGPNTFELTAVVNRDIFILKLDANGNFVWAKRMGNSERDLGNAIATDSFDNVYTTGGFRGTVDFDPNAGIAELTSNGFFDTFIQKLDTNGNFIWAKSMGGVRSEEGINITIDENGTIYSSGVFGDTVDFDPNAGIANLTSNGQDDIYVQKLDTDGNFIWAKSFGGPDYDFPGATKIDNSGNVFTTGGFSGTIDFDPSSGTTNLTSAGYDDIFIQKLNSNGDFNWAKRIGGASFDAAYSMAIDVSGDLYFTGQFGDIVDFDPNAGVSNLTSESGTNIFIQKLNNNGDFLWAKTIGGTALSAGFSIALNPNGGLYCSGLFAGTGDFDPGSGVTNLTAIDPIFGDLFFLKLSSTLGADSNIIGLKPQLFPNPTSGKFTIDLDKSYSKINTTITNVLGQVIAFKRFVNTDTLDLNIEARTGIYFVNVTTQEGLSETIKIIKQ